MMSLIPPLMIVVYGLNIFGDALRDLLDPNSIIYGISSHKERPNVIVAASIFGYVYLSEDGGDSWQKLQKEFGEVRSVALLPN